MLQRRKHGIDQAEFRADHYLTPQDNWKQLFKMSLSKVMNQTDHRKQGQNGHNIRFSSHKFTQASGKYYQASVSPLWILVAALFNVVLMDSNTSP